MAATAAAGEESLSADAISLLLLLMLGALGLGCCFCLATALGLRDTQMPWERACVAAVPPPPDVPDKRRA